MKTLYAIAMLDENKNEVYLQQNGKFSSNIEAGCLVYEFYAEIPPLDNDEQYIAKIFESEEDELNG